MLISCEKCTTTYVLDDALIPPQGAPVQCTRCGHVFTARLTTTEPAAPPPRAAAAPGNSTMMFGNAAANQSSQPPPAANKNQTMMFGTPASNAAAPQAPQAPASARSTMMFGSPSAAPPPPAPNKNQTMMFGTPASNAAAAAPPPPAAPPPSSKATMVFGAPPAAPAAPNKNQTMMFGTPASNAAAASQPSAPAASSKQTMVFGSAAPAAPPPNAKQTMMFGTPASNAAAASQPNAPAASSKQTMVFGTGVAAPPPPAAPAKNQTMMFGTPASNAASQVGEETLMDTPGQSSRTVLFGQPAQPPAAKNTTMMFGRPAAIPKISAGVADLAGMSANEGAPNERTVRVDEAQVVAEHESEDPAADLPQIPRHDRTQRFAMSDAGPTPIASRSSGDKSSGESVQDRHNRTQLFAMSTAQERTLPVAEPAVEVEANDPSTRSTVMLGDAATLPPGSMPTIDRASRMGGTDLNSTLPPDAMMGEPTMMDSSVTAQSLGDPPGVSLLHDPSNMTPPEAMPAHQPEGPVATTLPNLPVLKEQLRPLALELPPEPMGSPQDLRSPPVLNNQQAAEDAAAMKAARSGGAGRAIVIILVLVALALAGVLVYRLFGKQLLGNLLGTAVPVEAIQQTEQALATLRFDDQSSQDKAVAQLSAVLAQHPALPETQAALVIATALRFDDVQGEVERGAEAMKALKSNGATETQLKALEARITAGKASTKELRGKLEEGLAKLQAMMPNSEAGSATHLALLRADGLARGVLGDGEALTRAVAYKQRTANRDDWVDLIEPEFALNGGTALDEAIAQLAELKTRGTNSTFLRPYVLLARLQLKKGEPQAARNELEQVATMNAQHEIAREMLASIAK